MKKLQFNDFFIIFIFSGILGVIIETLFWFLKSGEFAHRGSLIYTPINLIYSIGAILLTLLVYKMDIKNPFKIFIISFIAGTLIEYLASYLQELTLGTISWDYSKKFLNINGRALFVYSSSWAYLGCIWALYILPR